MELMLVWTVLRRWWWLIAIPVVISLVWALPALPSAIAPPATYGTTIRFTAAAPPSAENALASATDPQARSGSYEDTAYVPWLASEYLVFNLPQWITSTSFANAVSRQLAIQGLAVDKDNLRRAFAADANRSILQVAIGWDDAIELEQIAAAAIHVLQAQSQDYFPQLASSPAIVVPLDEVKVVQTAPPLTARLQPFVRVVVGLVFGMGLAFLATYLDRTIYTTEDLEDIGLMVLARVPKA